MLEFFLLPIFCYSIMLIICPLHVCWLLLIFIETWTSQFTLANFDVIFFPFLSKALDYVYFSVLHFWRLFSDNDWLLLMSYFGLLFYPGIIILLYTLEKQNTQRNFYHCYCQQCQTASGRSILLDHFMSSLFKYATSKSFP